MPIEAELPDGRILEFPDGTDPAVIQAAVKRTLGVPESPQSSGLERMMGILEAAATIGTGAVAEPVAGLAGIGAQLTPGGRTGAEQVQATREALTFEPRTESGQQALQSVGEALQPIGEAISGAESALGNAAFQATGSPAIAAAAESIPTAIGEILGLGAVRGARAAARSIDENNITRTLESAAPTSEQLRAASTGIFKEIEDLGASVQENQFSGLVQDINKAARAKGARPRTTPQVIGIVEEFQNVLDRAEPVSIDETIELRTVAKNIANSTDPAIQAPAIAVIDEIDAFLDKGDEILTAAQGVNIGDRLSIARELWGRAKRSELLNEAITKARDQATGFENGLRNQFRSILSNKKQKRFFNKNEISAMRQVVRGGKDANLAKLIGRLGFSEGQATNIVGGAIGAGAGAAIGGGIGAVIVPTIGTISRSLAQRLTEGSARFADSVIRAGKNGKKIVRAYIENTPKNQRSASELSELLITQDIDLNQVGQSSLAIEAARIAQRRRIELASAAAGGSLVSGLTTEQEQPPQR